MDQKVLALLGIGFLAYKSLSQDDINNFIKNGFRFSPINQNQVPPPSNGQPMNNASLMGTPMAGIPLSEFVSTRYRISFKYPSAWQKNPRYEDKYEGESGFFEVGDFSGIPGETIDQAVTQQINESYMPYGSNPTVRSFTVDGQPARVIYPSEDQPDIVSDREAALVVQYKRPLMIGGEEYPFVVIWASRDYMPLIISTFNFIND